MCCCTQYWKWRGWWGEFLVTQQLLTANARLDQEIFSFDPRAYSLVEKDTFGRPWSGEKYSNILARLRAARVAPHFVAVLLRDSVMQIGMEEPEELQCVGLTKEESGCKLAYCPARDQFVLIQRQNDAPWETFNIWGDAVGCYAAM